MKPKEPYSRVLAVDLMSGQEHLSQRPSVIVEIYIKFVEAMACTLDRAHMIDCDTLGGQKAMCAGESVDEWTLIKQRCI